MNNIMNDIESTVFIDESSIWTLRSGLYHHRRKSSTLKSNCIHPLNPEKVHIWGGISWSGPTPFHCFVNNLNADGCVRIINEI